MNVYEHFEELGRRKRTEGSLKQTCDAPGLSRSSINLTVLMTNDFRHFQFSLFVKSFFQNNVGFIAAQNCKRRYLVIILIV